MANPLTEERAEAVRRAIEFIREEYAREHGKPPVQKQLADWFGVTQAYVSSLKGQHAVGERLADGVARRLNTTVDGLVRQFLKQEETEVRVSDLQGWDEALAKAKENAGPAGEAFPWAAVAHVTLPVAPQRATPELAYELAHLLYKFGRGSGFMRKVK